MGTRDLCLDLRGRVVGVGAGAEAGGRNGLMMM
jgi:hypothetical protein